MSVNGIDELPTYLDFIRTHPGEAGALLKDLLISVTNFFRDRDAFDALEAQIPALFAGKAAGDEVRVWVPACATGEEAYSIAMMLAEHARLLDAPPALQVFATDLDDDAIRAAREGVYPAAIAADVSEERLRRFFTRDVRGYRIRSELREAVVFATHDLLKDAPFSRLDLVSCRNLFIYLDPQAQQRALEIVHFALRPHGRLFLGVSETVDPGAHLFRAVDQKHRIYEPRLVRERRLPPVAADGVLVRAQAAQGPGGDGAGREPAGSASFLTQPAEPGRPRHRLVARAAPEADRALRAGLGHRHRRLRDGPHLRARRTLPAPRAPASRPTTSCSPSSPALTGDLRTALLRAREADEVRRDGADPVRPRRRVDLGADPRRPRRRHRRRASCSSRFVPVAEEAVPRAPSPSTPESDAYLHRLQQQVDELKWHLRDATEQGTVTAQELKASNEELQAMNEELRSATEELETSREELQSINEELTTVNQELKVKVDELSHANGDLQNLMAATAIATVFLDREPVHLALHAVGGRAVQPDRRRRRPADQRPRQPARLPAAQRRRRRPCSTR